MTDDQGMVFRRRPGLVAFGLLLPGYFTWSAVAALFHGDLLWAGVAALFAIGWLTETLWAIAKPLAEVDANGLLVRESLFAKPRQTTWDSVVGLSHERFRSLGLLLREGPPLLIPTGALKESDRSALLAHIETCIGHG